VPAKPDEVCKELDSAAIPTPKAVGYEAKMDTANGVTTKTRFGLNLNNL